LLEEIADLLRERVDDVDPSQGQKLEELLKTRLVEWKSWNPQDWTSYEYDRIPLLRQAGSYVPPHWRFLTWSTARSMRNVDAECQTVITTMIAAEETANE
jgi:hypothetical protein